MKILVACEYSGVVRDAFILKGHDAISCDLLPTESPGPHIQDDVSCVLSKPWDLIIAHPPCTYLCSSGARWLYEEEGRWLKRERALEFVYLFRDCNCPKVAIENPVGVISTRWRKPDQIIQPWQFGHGEKKATCLWIKGLPLLQQVNVVGGRDNRIHRLAPSANRGKIRSKTFQGFADAMADQWGG